MFEHRIAPEGVVGEPEIGPKGELAELSGRGLSFDDLTMSSKSSPRDASVISGVFAS
jgi:hypothetical protein